jgi:hypothetical protein
MGFPSASPSFVLAPSKSPRNGCPIWCTTSTCGSKLEGKQARPDVLKGSNQLFVACQTDDDLPYVLKYAGENCLMVGSDYGHADNASELLALRRLKENGAIAPVVIDKILCTNPARFYGLD